MNKSDLVLEVARAAGLTREVSEAVVTAVFERITAALVKGERVELRPLRKVPSFRMGKELRANLNPEAVPAKVHA